MSALIFDMDGTLWDAVDSYVEVWLKSFADCGLDANVTREMLLGQMGRHLDDIARTLVPDAPDMDRLVAAIMKTERELMPVLGGRLYPGVKETMARLSTGHKLFMVSNCGEHGLDNFLTITGLKQYMTDWLSHGQTKKPKAQNIATLIERYSLDNAVYVGDTQSDADAAHAAGLPIVWCTYGFGHVANPDYTINSFPEILNLGL